MTPERRSAKKTEIKKAFVDTLLLVSVFLLMGRHLWPHGFHSWLGLCLAVPLIWHASLNRSWWRGLFRGKYTLRRAFKLIVNAILLLLLLILFAGGIVMSHFRFWIPELPGMHVSIVLHVWASHWFFALAGVHLGLNWNSYSGMMRHILKAPPPSPFRRMVARDAALAASVWGIAAFFHRDFPIYMLFLWERYHPAKGEPKLLFLIDFACVFILFWSLGRLAARLPADGAAFKPVP